MVWSVPDDHPLRRLFAGLVEQVFFSDLGICDPRVTDYVSGLLVEFVHVDHIYRLRNVDGQVIREVSRIEADARLADVAPRAARDCVVHRYIGDFTLFWTGVYPESLRPRLSGSDRMQEFLLQGKRSYEIAGELSDASGDPPAAVLLALSKEFESCVHGLHLVRTGWERACANGSDGPLRLDPN